MLLPSMKNCIQCESLKIRHSRIRIAFLLVPLIPAMMGTQNYLNNLTLLKSQWFSLWTQQTLFYSDFFFAPLTAVYCGYLWRLENQNKNRHLLLTMPVPVSAVFLGKLFSMGKIVLLTQLWMLGLFLLSGHLVGLPGMPDKIIFFYLLRGLLGAMVVAALQLFLSMLIKSFAAPIALSVIGGVTGMLAANRPAGVFYPYSLMLMGMNANRSEDQLTGSGVVFLLSCLAWLLAISAAAIYLLRRRDV